MNGIQNRKTHNLEKTFPGCMGRMVNLFDLSAGMAGNRLLTEKAHWDGYQLPRSQSYGSKMSNPIGDQFEEKPIRSSLRRTSSSKKSNGTPMKMLIAQELSKELESNNPPNVVAKLMGLDALPRQHPGSAAQRSQRKGCSPDTSPQIGEPLRYWQPEGGFLDKKMVCEIHAYEEKKDYKDVYEVWQQYPKTIPIKDKSLQKGRCNENLNEKKMALVRQKFIEAKRLATDERLRQSKEFQDALEVLSSNKDLFLKFLQEPNTVFSQQLYELPSIPPPPQSKRITVLRPSKTMKNNRFAGPEKKSEKQIKKQTRMVPTQGGEKDEPARDPIFTNQKADDSSQPTRIVVLKPSPGNARDTKAVGSSSCSSPRIQHSQDFCGMPKDDEARESIEVAKEITRKMRENLSSHEMDETYLSSAFSSGYVRDESSFNKSENEFIDEGNLSDSEPITPTSRHSWDYSNRFGSPYSSSSFSRASNSPESSVCREAKKRLSERWTMISNGTGQEQRQVRRSSSTLGEMLALSDTKNCERSSEDGNDDGLSVLSSRSCGGKSDVGGKKSSLMDEDRDEGGADSPKNLSRSRSVPLSSTVYGTRLNVEVPDSGVNKSPVPKEAVKSKSGKSSFKGKVSSLFFSRNKKSNKEKSVASPVPGSKYESQSTIAEVPRVLEHPFIAVPKCVIHNGFEGGLSRSLREASSKTPTSASKQGTISFEPGMCQAKSETPTNAIENQDQPSPISVLDAPFEDVNTTPQSSGNITSDHRAGTSVHPHSLKSNLIDKSPPIESIARTLSWDDACLQTATPNPLKISTVLRKAEEEEQERLLFVQSLLSAAGLCKVELSDTITTRWHSSESPLDPSLIDRYFDPKDNKDYQHEAKRRQQRSNQRLLFDCVNAALVDITRYGYGSNASPWPRTSCGALDKLSVGAPATVDQVWDRIKEWFSGEARCFMGESRVNNSLVVERVVRKEVVGRGWVELMRLEIDGIGKEIQGKILEELVEEAVVDLTGSLC